MVASRPLLIAFAGWLAGPCGADVIRYSSRAEFESDNTGLLLETFSVPFATAASVDFGAFVAAVDLSLLAHLEGSRLQKQGLGLDAHTVTLTFDQPVYAMAIFIRDFGARTPGTLRIATETGSFDEQVAEVVADQSVNVFFGLRDDDGFTTLRMVNTTGGDSIEYDDVLFTFTRRPCPPDLSGSSNPLSADYGVPDGQADSADFFYFLDQFALGNLAIADVSGSSDPNAPGYGVADGMLDAADFFYFLDLLAAGCS